MNRYNAHHPVEGRETVWLTPPHIVQALGEFDLAPCAAPLPRPWENARVSYTLPQDGLSLPWFGRVWCNPPYGNETWKWLHRLAEHGTGTALVFARTDTTGFHAAVWERATALLFLKGRLHFHYRDGTRARANSGAPSILVAYGDSDAAALKGSGLPGHLVNLRDSNERSVKV